MTDQPDDPERGAALITVMFVISICALVAMAMLSRQKVDVESAASLIDQAQAYQYALGGEDLARQVLADDAALMRGIDFPGQHWGQLHEGLSLDGGTIGLQIQDLQGLFNINTLIGGKDLPEQHFERLLALLHIEPAVETALIARMGTKDQPRPVTDINDLRTIDGLTPEDFKQLRDFVTALPDYNSLLNVNTAPVVVLKSYISDDKNYEHMIKSLRQNGYLSQPQLNAIGMNTEGMGAQSRYFLVNILVQRHGRALMLRSTIERQQDALGGVTLTTLSRNLSHDQ